MLDLLVPSPYTLAGPYHNLQRLYEMRVVDAFIMKRPEVCGAEVIRAAEQDAQWL